jgi:signal transduction histidine kinase
MALVRVPAFVAACVAAAVVAAVTVVGSIFAIQLGEARPAITFVIVALISAAAVAFGVLIAFHQPHNVVGLLLVLAGLLPVGAETRDLRDQVNAGATAVELALTSGAWMVFYLIPALLLLYFPDGRAAGPRWGWIGPTLLVVVAIFDIAAALDPAPFRSPYEHVAHPFRVPEKVYLLTGGVGVGLLPIFLGLLVAAAFSVLIRYHRATSDRLRAQLKWFALGAAFLPGSLLLAWVSYLLFGAGQVILVGFALTCLAVPAAIAVAVLRPEVLDVARAISATITYGLVATAVLACYTIVSFAVGLVSGLGSGRISPIGAVAATVLGGLLVAPLRGRLQRRVDRKVYPARRAALVAIEQLQARTDAGEDQPEHLERVLQIALHDPSLRVGYRVPGTDGLVGADGTPLSLDDDPVCVPVVLAGQELGAIVQSRARSPALLRAVAAASALLVEVVRLRIERNQALEAVATSRSRLVVANLEKRRQLELDLKDGAEQRLESIGAALRLARRRLKDDESVDGLLEKAVAEVGTAAAEVRQVAHDLRPTSLDESLTEGLDHALAALASHVPVPVTLDVEVTALPDAIAATAYQVANEALANAVRHASPGAIGVHVRQADGVVTVKVRDDGRGGATMRPGAGLAGLADRVAAAGGALRLTSAMGLGTTVEAILPC